MRVLERSGWQWIKGLLGVGVLVAASGSTCPFAEELARQLALATAASQGAPPADNSPPANSENPPPTGGGGSSSQPASQPAFAYGVIYDHTFTWGPGNSTFAVHFPSSSAQTPLIPPDVYIEIEVYSPDSMGPAARLPKASGNDGELLTVTAEYLPGPVVQLNSEPAMPPLYETLVTQANDGYKVVLKRSPDSGTSTYRIIVTASPLGD